MKDLLITLMEDWDISASDEQLSQFETYARLLTERNRDMNLIGNSDPGEIAVRHFIDSLSLVCMGIDEGASVIDIGTGAGFPGVPVKIMRPDISLTLLDSQGKRLEFLKEAVEALKLENVTIIKARAEELALDDSYRERFDYAFSRAVAGMNILCELCMPFVKVGGLFCAMKSMDIAEEMLTARSAIDAMGGRELKPYKYTLPQREVNLQIIRIGKVKPTAKRYPRRYAKIKQQPL